MKLKRSYFKELPYELKNIIAEYFAPSQLHYNKNELMNAYSNCKI